MEDRDLIKMIKSLKQVEPGSDWVVSTRESILGQEELKSSWFMAHWQPALTGLGVGLALVGGLLGLIRFNQGTISEEEPVMVAETSPLFVLAEPLTGLKDQIVGLKDQLSDTREKRIDKNQQALEIQQMIQDIRDLTQNIEEVDREKVLATLSDEIKEAGEDIKLAFLETELNDLRDQAERGLLNQEKMVGLSEIEELYQTQDYESAFWRLIELIN
jgi:hypothetical protein